MKELRDRKQSDPTLQGLSTESRAFVRAIRTGAFDKLSPDDVEAWNHMSRENRVDALLPWMDWNEPKEKAIEHLQKTIRESEPRY